MKNNIKKQILLFSAFAMFVSTVPMQAEEAIVEEEMVTAPVAVQEEVAAKRGFFSGWTSGALHRRMREAMRDLDREWKPFIRCVKEGKGGCFQQAKTVRNLIGTILALIAVTATGIFVARRGRAGKGVAYTPEEQAFLNNVQTYLITDNIVAQQNAIRAINTIDLNSPVLDEVAQLIRTKRPSNFATNNIYIAVTTRMGYRR